MIQNKYPKIKNTVIKNLLEEAKRSGIKVKQIDKRFLTFELTYQGQKHYIFHKKIGINSANAALVSNKFLTSQILAQAGFKVPKSFLVTNESDVINLLRQKK